MRRNLSPGGHVMPEYAGIHLLDNPYFLDNAFDYFIPPELSDRIGKTGNIAVVGVTDMNFVNGIVALFDDRNNSN